MKEAPHGGQSGSEALFQPVRMGSITLKNRLIRAATYEGLATRDGTPRPELGELYARLAGGGVGAVITGFAFVSQAGRAMQLGQCGAESDDRIEPWRAVLARARQAGDDVKFFMQLAHAGRQTRSKVTGVPVRGASSRRCTYFRQRVSALRDSEVLEVIRQFGAAAQRAQQAGFDGVQVHAAHGYLLHQFLSPWTNTRTDRWADGGAVLEQVVADIKRRCGPTFPILLKVSAADDNTPGLRVERMIELVRRLEACGVDAVEVSYGTMEFALNIIRGGHPVNAVFKVNPLFRDMPAPVRRIWKMFFMKAYLRRFTPFQENYNLPAAVLIQEATTLPVILVGGLRSVAGMVRCLTEHGMAAVSLCRPLICEPDLPRRIREGGVLRSQCTNCNLCTIHCDSENPVRCYVGGGRP